MNAFEIKVHLLRNGLTIASMSEELTRNSKTKKTSMQTMISDMIYGRRFYPGLAKTIKKKFGLEFERPARFESASEIIKQAA